MNCKEILDMAYEDNTGILGYLQIRLHTLFCSDCAQKIELYHAARVTMREDFFPYSPNMEESIMDRIAAEKFEEQPNSVPGVLSTRGWVIAGLIIFISFITAFFGMDFQNVVNETGTSFLLPVGILFGIVLTIYCSIFIGSHLKELTERFL